MYSKIAKIDYYLPGQVLSNSDLEKVFPDWSAEKIEAKVGIKERHIAAGNETALDMAEQAAIKVLAGIDRQKIDFLMLCTQSPDYFLPTSACILQDRLGLSKSCGALDFNLGCSGFIYGLALAKGLISSLVAKRVLLITSETYSKHMSCDDKGNRSIFGDGAAATLVTASGRNEIRTFVLGTDGSGYEHLIVAGGAMRATALQETEEKDSREMDSHLYMDGSEIFSFTIDTIPKLVEDTLQANGMKIEDVDYFVFHQANKFILEYLRDHIGIAPEKFYQDMQFTGNTVSASIPIAMAECLGTGKIKRGDKVMLVGFGVGLSWGACIVQI